MTRTSLAALLAACCAAAGCAGVYGGPRYEQARGAHDVGYYETRLADNRYVVQYRAEREDERLAEDFAMRRAAELTLEQDYDWFQILSRRGMSDESFQRYDAYRFYADRYRDRPPYRDTYGGGGDYESAVVLEIVMGFNPPPHGESIYDARRLLDDLRVRY
jgi:hypothetical protein